MEICAALLRGVNVGGRTVKMDRLKSLFEGMGFTGVRTYIQSGNVLFASGEAPGDGLRARIGEELRRSLGFEVSVVLLSAAELREIVAENPFEGGVMAANGRVYVTVPQEPPAPDALRALPPDPKSPDGFAVCGRAIFIRCAGGYHDTAYSNAFFERKLQSPCTTRNIETMTKLAGMAAEAQA